MTAKNLQNIRTYLEDTGFVQKRENLFSWVEGDGRAPHRKQLPWQIADWSIELHGQDLVQTSFEAQLRFDLVIQNLEDLLRERFRSFRLAAYQRDSKAGIWLLLEFLDKDLDADQSRLIEEDGLQGEQLPHGLAGVQISVIQALGQLSVFMTRHFFIGNVPGQIFLEFPKILNEAIFGHALKSASSFNAYVCTIGSEELRTALTQSSPLPDFLLDWIRSDKAKQEDPLQQVRLQVRGEAWSLQWIREQELPELVVPPIEVLEQKEVARRFQRLDELILLEEYPKALEQCREYLQQFPQSLYLTRRWAFLTLWAAKPFERRYLDLMSKYDPQNFMTLSLWIRHSQSERIADAFLENLSKLGNSLGQTIEDFDRIDVTGLTLPEMLGDAWNEKDDQRAVVCYERVLQTRGEIPRILVKLIRLMRDIGDAQAEEAYMDRLLACEVPLRTRAAIYFRLAEIKQEADPEEAAQWALKSWQTNRAQARYALLASDLLIDLKRAHEAVHVLVETSELLTADIPQRQRLDLELRIGSIWLEQLQRFDLALERLERARDLVGNDLAAFDKMIELAQRLGDETLLIDILLRALQVAIQARDPDRTRVAAGYLMNIAHNVTDPERKGKIYSQVLACSLLDVEQVEAILSHTEYKLPYGDLIQAMGQTLKLIAPENAGRYFLLLGDAARRFLFDVDLAQNYYEQALQVDCMSQTAFDFLDEQYGRKGLNEQRYQLLKKRFELAQESEKHVILRELFYFDEGVHEDERDQYAIQLFIFDPDDVGPLKERVAIYEEQGDAIAISSLLDQLVEATQSSYGLVGVIRHGIETLSGLTYEGRYQIMDHLLQRLHELQQNPVEHARFALGVLWADPSKSYVKPYLEYLITLGEVPPYEEKVMLEILDDRQAKVDLLTRLATRSDPDERKVYLRHAYRISKEIQGPVSQKLEILHRLGEMVSLQEDELSDIVKALRQTGKYDFILGLIAHQLRLSSDPHLRERLCVLACEFLQARQHDEQQLAMLKFSLDHLQEGQKERIKISWLEHVGLDADLHDEAFALKILRQPSSWDYQKAVCILLREMVQTWRTAAVAESIVAPVLKIFMDDSNEEHLRFYLDNIDVFGLLNEQSSFAAFEFFSRQRDLASAERYWLLALKRAVSSVQANGMLSSSMDLWRKMGLEAEFYEILSKTADNTQASLFKVEVFREIRLFLGENLVQQHRDLRRAQSMLEQVYAANQDEARTWAPLICIYRESAAETDLYELLYRTLPVLRKQRDLLRVYDLDFDSLESELISIAQRLGLKSEPIELHEPIPAQDLEFGTGRSELADLDLSSPAAYLGEAGEHMATVAQPAGAIFSMRLGDEDSKIPSHDPKKAFADEDGAWSSRDLTLANFTYEKDQMARFETQVADSIVPPFGSKPPIPPPVVGLSLDADETATRRGLGSAKEQGEVGLNSSRVQGRKNDHLPIPPAPPSAPPSLMPRLMAELGIDPNEPTLIHKPDSVSASIAQTLVHAGETPLPPPFEPGEWRTVATQGKAKAGLSAWIVQQNWTEKSEQHVALQVAALTEEDFNSLKQWPHQIWRDAGTLFYDLRWTDRMGRESFHPGIKSPLSRLLKNLYPLVQQQYLNLLNIKGIAERLKIRSDELLKVRRPIDWKDEVVQRSGLRFYTKYLIDNGFHLYHWNKMEDRFQFDFEKRDIYIDREHYLVAPPTHLFHRLAFLIRAVSLEYYPYLHLSPSNDIFPFLMKCRRSLEQGRMDSVRRMLGMEKDPLKLMLSQADRDYMEQLFVEVGALSPDKLTKITGVYVDQIYRLNLAETLDLVGIIEAIANYDMLKEPSRTPAIIQQSAAIRVLMAFAAELKFGTKPPLGS